MTRQQTGDQGLVQKWAGPVLLTVITVLIGIITTKVVTFDSRISVLEEKSTTYIRQDIAELQHKAIQDSCK